MPIPLAQAGLAALLTAAAPAGSNPLLAPWSGPHGGVPPFDRVKVEDFENSVNAMMLVSFVGGLYAKSVLEAAKSAFKVVFRA